MHPFLEWLLKKWSTLYVLHLSVNCVSLQNAEAQSWFHTKQMPQHLRQNDYYPPSLPRHFRLEGTKAINSHIRASKRAWQIIIILTHAPRHLLDAGPELYIILHSIQTYKIQNYHLFDGREVLRPLQRRFPPSRNGCTVNYVTSGSPQQATYQVE